VAVLASGVPDAVDGRAGTPLADTAAPAAAVLATAKAPGVAVVGVDVGAVVVSAVDVVDGGPAVVV
jgi:transcriptional regulator GlxA family with amidase domain